MKPAISLLDSGPRRAEYGCIVTFENALGKTFSVHRVGPPMAGVREACAIALELDSSFRVVSYSTPQTIYTDMQGARSPSEQPALEREAARPTLPEAQMLGRLKLAHMLHPRLVA